MFKKIIYSLGHFSNPVYSLAIEAFQKLAEDRGMTFQWDENSFLNIDSWSKQCKRAELGVDAFRKLVWARLGFEGEVDIDAFDGAWLKMLKPDQVDSFREKLYQIKEQGDLVLVSDIHPINAAYYREIFDEDEQLKDIPLYLLGEMNWQKKDAGEVVFENITALYKQVLSEQDPENTTLVLIDPNSLQGDFATQTERKNEVLIKIADDQGITVQYAAIDNPCELYDISDISKLSLNP